MLSFEDFETYSFVSFETEPVSEAKFSFEIEFERFLCSFRDNPHFMKAKSGTKLSEIPLETQFLLLKKNDLYTFVVPLCTDSVRAVIGGGEQLYFFVETGSEAVKVSNGLCGFISSGNNPYELISKSIEIISKRLKTFSLRNEKKKPDFLQKFGFCSWNAMGIDVSEEKICEAVKSFGEYFPRFVIMDDGWQSTTNDEKSRGEWKLTSFKPNEKLPNGLLHLSKALKNIGVDEFFVWHALFGYWDGIDVNSPEKENYNPVLIETVPNENIYKNYPQRKKPDSFLYGRPDLSKTSEFFNDYHKYLKSQGVDGVKIDTQYCGEFACFDVGRSKMYDVIRTNLEASCEENFNGELINCMGLLNDNIFRMKQTNISRTSEDFFPEIPESHYIQIYDNAVNSLFLRDIFIPDWDMFMTDHEYGEIHAVARAISGGPIYVTDEIGKHNFDIVKRLRMSNGDVPICQNTATLSIDCLFMNPFVDEKPFVIENENKFSKVRASFNAHQDGKTVLGTTELCYSFKHSKMFGGEYSLCENSFDIFTYPNNFNGYYVIGLTEFYNPGGSVDEILLKENVIEIKLLDLGKVSVYSKKTPKKIICDNVNVDFEITDNIISFEVKNKNFEIYM